MPAIAVDGSLTDHGGVIEAIVTASLCGGERIATVGAIHRCPVHGHGTNEVVEGSATVWVEGKPVARVGDRCGCGAVIITGIPTVLVGG
jgi:uncharacterized Zn-binding protein involved in type VI secretion